MNKTSLVSIIIPCYNAEKYVAETLDSVIAQTHANWECIIVDDHSTDNSWEIIESYKQRYPEQIFIYKNPRKGACAARNTGIEYAQGEYIQFLDADDLLGPNKLGLHVNLLENNTDSIANCAFVKFKDKPSNVLGPVGPHPKLRKNLSPINWILQQHTMLVHAWLTPAHYIKNQTLWNESLVINQDGEYFNRVITKTKHILYTDKCSVYYRADNASSTSKVNSQIKMEGVFISAVCIEENLSPYKKTHPKINTVIGNLFAKYLYMAYIDYPWLYDKYKNHWALKYADIKYNAGGKIASSIHALIGWKLTKRIKSFLK